MDEWRRQVDCFSVFGLEVARGYLVIFLSEFTGTCPHLMAREAGGAVHLPTCGWAYRSTPVEPEKDRL